MPRVLHVHGVQWTREGVGVCLCGAVFKRFRNGRTRGGILKMWYSPRFQARLRKERRPMALRG